MTNTEHVDSMFWLEMYPELSRPALRAVFYGIQISMTSKIILYDRTQKFRILQRKGEYVATRTSNIFAS